MRVKFQRFVFGEGYTWRAGSEGEVLEETQDFYKVKTGWFSYEWVGKFYCQEITQLPKP